MWYNYVLPLLCIPLAFLAEGLRRKLIARMQNRIGPPLSQPFYDILKLLEKENDDRRNIIFNVVPWLVLTSALLLFLLPPLGWVKFDYDFFLVGYLFILTDVLCVIGSLSSRSPFGFQASMRAVLLGIGYRVAFLASLIAFASKAGITSLALYPQTLILLQLPLASCILLLVGYVIIKVQPYDVVNAEPEISGGMFTEYFGRNLALLKTAELCKNFAFYILAAYLTLGAKWFAFGVPALVFFYSLSSATNPRYSTFQSTRNFMIICALALMELVILI